MSLRPFGLALALICASLPLNLHAAPKLVPIADSYLNSPASSNPRAFVRVGSVVYFIADDGVHGEEIWKTDGTAGGTQLVKDLAPGSATSSPTLVGVLDNLLLFTTPRNDGIALSRTDGTAAGTFELVVALPPQQYSNGFYTEVVTAGTRAYLLVQPAYGIPADVYVTDGTVTNTRKVGSYPLIFEAVPGAGGKLFFAAQDNVVGRQLWMTDGTANGTHIVRRNIECPGPMCDAAPGHLFTLGGAVYFTTAGGLWKTDGTAGGTVMVAAQPNLGLLGTAGPLAYLYEYVYPTATLWRYDASGGPIRSGTPWSINEPWVVLDDGRLVFVHYTSPRGWMSP